MPSSTKKQAQFMEAIAHGMKPRKGDPSVAVAKEFVAADKGNKTVSKRHANDKGGYQADKIAAIPGRQPEY
jgi:hypothetical protein